MGIIKIKMFKRPSHLSQSRDIPLEIVTMENRLSEDNLLVSTSHPSPPLNMTALYLFICSSFYLYFIGFW